MPFHDQMNSSPHSIDSDMSSLDDSVGGGVLHSPFHAFQAQHPSPDTSPSIVNLPHSASGHTNANAANVAALSINASFFQGTAASSNETTLYIQVSGDETKGLALTNDREPIWVTVPWPQVMREIAKSDSLALHFVHYIKANPRLRAQYVRALATAHQLGNTSAGLDHFGLPPSPLPAMPDPSTSIFTNTNTIDTSSFWSSSSEYAASPLFGGHTGTSNSSRGTDSDASNTGSPASLTVSARDLAQHFFTTIPMPSPTTSSSAVAFSYSAPNSGGPTTSNSPTLFTGFPSVCTATPSTIDPSYPVQYDKQLNTTQLEYVWSHSDATLYEIGTNSASRALQAPGAIKFVFPPASMIMAVEKDGSPASPAFTPMHPHSNEWLKAQVCDRQCAYKAGLMSLKRPKTMREHFRKCIWIGEQHPLKVLATLELAVLERSSQGLLPNRRRSRASASGSF